MLEAKLAYAVNELINNINPNKKQFLLEKVGELLLNVSYFKMFMENYPDLGPLMYLNLVNNLSFKKYKEKTIIWDYNDPVDGVYIIISGEIKIYKPPIKSYLIRCINKDQKRIFNPKNHNNNPIYEQFSNLREKNIPILKLPKVPLNFLKKRTTIFSPDLYKQKKYILIKKNKHRKIPKCPSAKYINNLNLTIQEHINISANEQQVFLTEENYLYREPQELRRLDYTEKFGKMIGEDALLQELSYRKYACEASTNCILAFLNQKNYHIFFDKINNTNRGNIISFLYKVNYFNNKNDFIHKLCKGIRLKTYKKGTFIYQKNMPFLNMYILKNGIVAINVMKICKYISDMNPDLIIHSPKDKTKNNSSNNKNNINNRETINHFTKERTFEINGEYYEKRIYTLINYGRGEILGNLEYYLNLKKYIFSAKCITDVEFYEIDVKIFTNIQKPYNMEFFDEKTRHQIKYFSRRIKEINMIHQKNDEDQNRSRNKFMRIFYQRHPLSTLKINEKYINNGKISSPINLKYKKKIFKRTKISPFSFYELASVLGNYKNQNNKNLFITNLNDISNIFNGSNIKNNSLTKFHQKDNYKNELINFNNINKLKMNEKSISHSNNSNFENILEKNKKLSLNKIIESNSLSFNPELYSLSSLRKQNKYFKHKKNIKVDNENKLKNSKNAMRTSHSAFNFTFIQNKKKYNEFINTFINIYNNVQKNKFEKQEQKLKGKRVKIGKKREASNMIAFNGYRVYLNKNKGTKISLKKNFQ